MRLAACPMRFFSVVAVPSLFFASSALAQRDTSAMLQGIVVDSARAPVPDVEVYSTTTGRGARTGLDGRFSIVHLVPGTHRIIVRRLGWNPIDTSLVVASGAPREVRFVLERVAQGLAAVVVTTHDACPVKTLEGFDCRRRAGIGVFRDRAELAALKPVYKGDFFWGIPGLRAVMTKNALGDLEMTVESTTGWRCIVTLVDGRPLTDPNSVGSLRFDRLKVSDFVAIEFYESPDKVPEWYRAHAFAEGTLAGSRRSSGRGRGILAAPSRMPGRQCALAIYWTKYAPKYDPTLDQSTAVGAARTARLAADARRLDSLTRKRDSAAKKPD